MRPAARALVALLALALLAPLAQAEPACVGDACAAATTFEHGEGTCARPEPERLQSVGAWAVTPLVATSAGWSCGGWADSYGRQEMRRVGADASVAGVGRVDAHWRSWSAEGPFGSYGSCGLAFYATPEGGAPVGLYPDCVVPPPAPPALP